jgi:hypothetical protein
LARECFFFFFFLGLFGLFGLDAAVVGAALFWNLLRGVGEVENVTRGVDGGGASISITETEFERSPRLLLLRGGVSIRSWDWLFRFFGFNST